jgi:hypothetical protein
MANSRSSGTYKEYAKVDTLPTATGYYTNEVCLRDKVNAGNAKDKMWFSIRETVDDISEAPSALSTVTVALQFKCDGDVAWTDFVDLGGNSLAIGNRLEIEDTGAAVRWRAGVRSDEFTSGSVTFGFDW